MPTKVIDTTKKTNPTKGYTFAVGRRRSAVARVRAYNPSGGKLDVQGGEFQRGDVVVNGKPFATYFRFAGYGSTLKEFFDLTKSREKFLFSIKVAGGGLKGQLEASILGMSRVLEKIDHDHFRPLLKPYGYLTRDPRIRERRKVGTGGKARRKKQSPKR